MVSAVRADAQKCPCPRTNPPAQTVYPLQGGKVHPNFEKKTNFREKHFTPPLRPEKYADSIGEIGF